MKFLFVLTLAILSFAAVNAGSGSNEAPAPAPAPSPAQASDSLQNLLNEILHKINCLVNAVSAKAGDVTQVVGNELHNIEAKLPKSGLLSVARNVVGKTDDAAEGLAAGLKGQSS